MAKPKIVDRAKPFNRKGLTMLGTHVVAVAAVRNPTVAITGKGQLIVKTRKPG